MRPTYAEYWDSDVEWIGEVPVHWDTRRLKTLADYRTSSVDKKSAPEEMAVRLCNYTDVYYRERIVAGDNNFMSATASAHEIEQFSLRVGDVLITKDSEDWSDIAVPALVEETADDLVCGYHLGIVRPRSRLEPVFLLRAMQSKNVNVQLQTAATGVTRYGVVQGAVGRVVLPVPPLEEQAQIGAFLDRETARIDKLITMQESLIERLDEYRTALITRVVTKGLPPEGGVAKSIRPDPWRDLRLKNLVRFSPGRFIEPREMNEAGPVPVYGANGIRGYTGTPTHEGPALVTGRVGTCGTISMEAGPLWATNNAIVMHPTDRCDLRWLRYAVEEMDLGRYTASTAQPALHMDTVRNLRMKVPPRTTQTKMADYLDHNTASIGALQEKATELIDRSLEFRNALVTAAVTGKINLTPRARKAEPPLGLSTSQ